MPNCKQCKSSFEIKEADRKFYQKMDVPEPTLCPDCRQQRRMTYRNERTFYRRKCDKCQKNIISIYHSETPFPVYCRECWWGDDWNPMDFAQDFDFNRPFFEQFSELFNKVPQLFMINALGENVDYSNYGYRNKDCYLLIASDDCESCHFVHYLWDCKDCLDCLYATKSQLCYELIESHTCYHCLYSQRLESCNDCWFSFDLKGCNNCFGCAGLRHKSYYWFNKPLDKATYEDRIRNMTFSSGIIEDLRQKAQNLKTKILHQYANLVNCENCTGDSLKDCKNAQECYDSYDLEDCKFITNGPGKVKNCYDFDGCKELELSYEGISSGGPGIFLRFNNHAWTGCNDVAYSAFSVSSKYLFGCVCLRHKEHCILNKQYSEKDYETLLLKIINYMQKTGEWGEFFSISLSPFAYNEILANDYYPLTKEEALKKGWKWKESDQKEYQPQTIQVQDNIKDVADDITNEILACDCLHCEAHRAKKCRKNFKIISQELRFYRQNNLSIPRKCPDCRHRDRMKLRNPRRIYDRKCDNCKKEIQSTYAPDRPEKVYCEECYLKEVY